MAWKFPVPPDTPVQMHCSIFQGSPVRFVQHDERGNWYFLDGRVVFYGGETTSAPLTDVLALDPGLEELSDLPKNWQARRLSAHDRWQRESCASQEQTRRQAAEALKELQRQSVNLPPGSPSTTELLREDRDR
jgi:hypothetical protein